MFCMAVFETNRERQNLLRDYLTAYSFEKAFDLDIYWFTDQYAVQKLESYADALCLALISLDESEGILFGEHLYKRNPVCRICYYKSAPCDLKTVLESRPAGFWLWPPAQTDFSAALDRMIMEMECAADFFCFATRQEIFHFPFSRILYFESDLKYVIMHSIKGETVRFPAKLSTVESQLGLSFIRIHKSYIVNRVYVRKVDKKLHICQMEGGEKLPISEAQYGKVIRSFTTGI